MASGLFNVICFIKDMTMNLSIISLLGLFLLTSCVVDRHPFKEGKIFAGKTVNAEVLNLGYTTYIEYCVQCHGMEGKGNGPSAKGLLPPPRNLTQGLYKFPWVEYGELPHDDDLARIIRYGLSGSAMLPWDISDERLDAVIQYIKTFAPEVWEGEDKTIGAKFELPADPYGADKKAQAIERGKKVYHVEAACIQCHRGYESRAAVTAWEGDGTAEDLYQLKPQDGEYNYRVLPPDFTYHPLRSVWEQEGILPSLVERLMYGVTGSGMPGWKDVVSDDDLWALAYYVQHLREIGQSTEERNKLMDRLDGKK
jgi:mono/diheme cytochrome c family protein